LATVAVAKLATGVPLMLTSSPANAIGFNAGVPLNVALVPPS
jgi:hypothetical protein